MDSHRSQVSWISSLLITLIMVSPSATRHLPSEFTPEAQIQTGGSADRVTTSMILSGSGVGGRAVDGRPVALADAVFLGLQQDVDDVRPEGSEGGPLSVEPAISVSEGAFRKVAAVEGREGTLDDAIFLGLQQDVDEAGSGVASGEGGLTVEPAISVSDGAFRNVATKRDSIPASSGALPGSGLHPVRVALVHASDYDGAEDSSDLRRDSHKEVAEEREALEQELESDLEAFEREEAKAMAVLNSLQSRDSSSEAQSGLTLRPAQEVGEQLPSVFINKGPGVSLEQASTAGSRAGGQADAPRKETPSTGSYSPVDELDAAVLAGLQVDEEYPESGEDGEVADGIRVLPEVTVSPEIFSKLGSHGKPEAGAGAGTEAVQVEEKPVVGKDSSGVEEDVDFPDFPTLPKVVSRDGTLRVEPGFKPNNPVVVAPGTLNQAPVDGDEGPDAVKVDPALSGAIEGGELDSPDDMDAVEVDQSQKSEQQEVAGSQGSGRGFGGHSEKGLVSVQGRGISRRWPALLLDIQ